MPRLSLYKPEKGNDYKFIDRQASEMFQVGGTDVYVHKYMGAALNPNGTADQPTIDSYSPTAIQDLLFLENRDRKYDQEIYRIRGIYNVQNIDFNLSQFGLFIDNDTIYMTVHINDFIKYVGRKPLSGDVLELPHLRDNFALNDFDMGLPRYYVIEDVGRASEGFSVTWYPHLYRLKLKKITDAQQFADILNKPALDANGDPLKDGTTLKDLLSTYNQELAINDQLIKQAEEDAPKSGYETRQFYTLAVDPSSGKSILETADEIDVLASNVSNINSSAINAIPQRSGYTGYLVGDGAAPNGYEPSNGDLSPFGFGMQFPDNAVDGDFFLRTDFFPNRLFRFTKTSWVALEDNVRMTMTNEDPTKPISSLNPSRQTLKTGFINNSNYTYNNAVASDYKTYSQVDIDQGVTTVNTIINFTDFSTAKYIVFKQSINVLDFVVSEHPADGTYLGLFTNTNNKITVTLPDNMRIPYPGQWSITLYNHREAERQSLSKALKPKADL